MGPFARRWAGLRRTWQNGSVYSASNLAGEPGRHAAQEVLYLDALVCEDARLHGRPLACLAVDNEKIYNTIQQLSVVDAVDECRGVPSAARRLVFEAFEGMQVQVETRWGYTQPITMTRVTAPEISKPAQEPILRLRDNSPAMKHQFRNLKSPEISNPAQAPRYEASVSYRTSR